MRATLVILLFGLSSSGCILQNMGAERQLTDQVYALNDEIRWARIDLATERVAPSFRTDFMILHRSWGHEIQIADSDCTHVQISEDSESATSLCTLSWYDQRTLELYTSVIEQRWIHTDNGFLLDRETVVGGEPGILETPPEDEETSEG